jgi:hypothetical protein
LTALIFHAYSLTPPTVAPGPSFHVVPTVERLGGTDSPDMNALAEMLRATD